MFCPKMKKLVETKDKSVELNLLRQLMEVYACCPNTTLWFKFFRSNGFLPPPNLEFGGCSVFMMIPGYGVESVAATALQYKIAMRESGEERDDDFKQLLGSSQYVAPLQPTKPTLCLRVLLISWKF